jgi:hypothetical protein
MFFRWRSPYSRGIVQYMQVSFRCPPSKLTLRLQVWNALRLLLWLSALSYLLLLYSPCMYCVVLFRYLTNELAAMGIKLTLKLSE